MFNFKLNEATLKLFKSFVIEDNKANELTIIKSFIITDKSLESYERSVVEIYKNVFNIDKLNNTFFTLKQSLETDVYERVLHQMFHYLTTYGAEYFNIDMKTYIPNKYYGQVNLNELPDPVYVPVLTYKELKEKLFQLLDSEVGLSPFILNNVMIVVEELVNEGYLFKKDFVNKSFKNKDLIAYIFNKFNWVPENVEDVIRMILSNYGLIKIKTRQVFNELKYDLSGIFERWLFEQEDSVEQLARTWKRNRFYYLALKHTLSDRGKSLINKARKLSNKLYKPVYIKNILDIDFEEFKDKVKKERWFTLVKWYNYLASFYVPYKIVYIRNGKLRYIESDPKLKYDFRLISKYQGVVLLELRDRFKSYFKDKTIYIPDTHSIALPTSMKKIISGIPEMSSYKFGSRVWNYVGIHWFDVGSNSVDLDLSCESLSGEFISWNTNWNSGDVVFSGDMTEAPIPDGATEIIAFKDRVPKLFRVNLYRGPFLNQDYTLLLGSTNVLEDKTSVKSLCFSIPIQFPNNREHVIGIATATKFIFVNRNLINSRVASDSNIDTKQLVNSFIDYEDITIKLNSVIDYTNEKTENVLDLSFGSLATDFWLDLFNNMY